jgi:hypothetical protein
MLKLLSGLWAALVLAGPAWGGPLDKMIDSSPDFEYQDDTKPWQEQKSALPAYPREGDWLELELGGDTGGFRYFLDPGSLSVGDDGVVRYAALITSESGVRNALYEGLRCSDRQYKTYAFGSDNRWQPMYRPAWKAVELAEQGPYRFRRVLQASYLCDTYRRTLPKEAILSRLRGLDSNDSPGLY